MKKKVFSLLLAGMLTFSMGTTAYATEDAIADMQAQKQQAEAGLAQTQANIDSLQSKKQELENYLSDLNTQYEDLTNAISELSIQAGEKENELKQLHTELKKAKKALNKQYDDMKLRIQYMYENGGTSALETLLSSKDLSEFLNNAESVAKISQYDRTMLEKCENLQNTIKDQETTAEEEKAAIDQLLEERAALTAEINNADNGIAQLVQQAEEEKAAREAAQAQAEAEAAAAQEQDAEESSDDYEEDTDSYEEDSSDSQDSSETEGSEDTSEDSGDSDDEDTYEENDADFYEGDSDSNESEDTSDSQASSDSSSGQGKYLGNFTLTAYCNCAQCCGTAGNLTASGTVPTAGRTVAMAGVPFGTQLLINGNVYTVEDLGTPYGHVDIYCDSHSEALSFGLQSAEVYQLN